MANILFLIGLPDPFAKVVVDGGQVFTTEACKATVDPKWGSHYDFFLSRGDGITISGMLKFLNLLRESTYNFKLIHRQCGIKKRCLKIQQVVLWDVSA